MFEEDGKETSDNEIVNTLSHESLEKIGQMKDTVWTDSTLYNSIVIVGSNHGALDYGNWYFTSQYGKLHEQIYLTVLALSD